MCAVGAFSACEMCFCTYFTYYAMDLWIPANCIEFVIMIKNCILTKFVGQ